jgi:hypothetical protein
MLHSDILSFIFCGTGWGVKIVVGSELSLDEVGLIMHIVWRNSRYANLCWNTLLTSLAGERSIQCIRPDNAFVNSYSLHTVFFPVFTVYKSYFRKLHKNDLATLFISINCHNKRSFALQKIYATSIYVLEVAAPNILRQLWIKMQ